MTLSKFTLDKLEEQWFISSEVLRKGLRRGHGHNGWKKMQGCGHEWMEDERGGGDIPEWVGRLLKRR